MDAVISNKRIELLAPAGGMNQLETAVRFGANAVYGGLNEYGLRAFAGNFSPAEMKTGVDLCHSANVRFYITMNILPKDADMTGFLNAAEIAAKCGVDAAIISDPGAAMLIHERIPELGIHISTQANVMNTYSARFFMQNTGAERIVLSREMTLDDISEMHSELKDSVELEAFVHGAMCVSYSGRCLLSNALLGRSGNRGACAQPCRWNYAIMEEKRPGEYYPIQEDENSTALLSAYDLCMLPYLPQLRNAGISSLKIEGRMKTAYYVATVVGAYRHALDALELDGESAFRTGVDEWMGELGKASHRKSNTGFYFGKPIPCAGADGFTQSMEYVGDFIENGEEGEWVTFKLKNRFYTGDKLEVLSPKGSKSFTAGTLKNEEGEFVETESVAGKMLKIQVPFKVEKGDILRGPNRNHMPIK